MEDTNYRRPYFYLFNKITDALVLLEQRNYGLAEEKLREAQIQAEELCIDEMAEEE